jgi:hypothetical protein
MDAFPNPRAPCLERAEWVLRRFLMRRVQLFEWEDQPWLPRVFRDFMTDHLRYSHNEAMRKPVNEAMAARVASLLARTRTTHIVDLCAGGGGPIAEIARILVQEQSLPVTVLLTDLFPNVAAFKAHEADSGGRVTARYESTNAADVPAELRGLRTMFAALHHFRPSQVKLVLADAVRKRAPIAVFEPMERTVRMSVLVGLMSFLRGLTHTHRVGKLTFGRALWTYVLPVAPAMFAWDGAVSALRMYTAGELLELAKNVDPTQYEWQAGRFDIRGPFGPMPTTYLTGVPL